MDFIKKMRFVRPNNRASKVEQYIAEKLTKESEVLLGPTAIGGSNYTFEELCLRNGWGCVEMPDKRWKISDCMTIGFCGQREYLQWLAHFRGRAVQLDFYQQFVRLIANKPVPVKVTRPTLKITYGPTIHLTRKPDGETA